MNWDHIKYFIATARAGSLTIAASAMNTSPATLSRRLASLEHDCGTTLFTRTHTGYSLTRDGEALLSRCLTIEEAFTSLAEALPAAHRGPSGSVRIATSENLANLVLLPALGTFRAAYPLIDIEIQTGAQPIALQGREADIAVRLSMPGTGNFKARVVARQAHALFASRRQADTGRQGEARIIGWLEDHLDLPIARAAAQHSLWRAPHLRLNTLQGHVAAARAGLGLAYLPCFVGDAHPDLTRIDGPEGLLSQEIYLILHNDTTETPRVRLAADFIIETLRVAAPALSGERGPAIATPYR